jgi:predicted amino acid-binding ACT domain protein
VWHTTAAKRRSRSSGCPDEPGQAARIFATVAAAESNLDMIVQNVSTESTGRTDISFTLPKDDGPSAMAALGRVQEQIGFKGLLYDDHIGKVSLIGAGMRSHPGVAAKFFNAMAEAGVNIEMISTSEIRVSVVCRDTDLDSAVRAVHDAFDLGGNTEAGRVRRHRSVAVTGSPTLAVVGATGAVGTVMCELLSSRKERVGRDQAGRLGPLGRAQGPRPRARS